MTVDKIDARTLALIGSKGLRRGLLTVQAFGQEMHKADPLSSGQQLNFKLAFPSRHILRLQRASDVPCTQGGSRCAQLPQSGMLGDRVRLLR
jgi:hypothetical protein